MKSVVLIILNIFLFAYCSFCQSAEQLLPSGNASICFVHIETGSLFNSPQNINLLILDKAYLPGYSIDFAYHSSDLLKTSQIAEDRNAVAAINGSFFDMNMGGSVTYSEKDDSVISRTRPSKLKWAVPASIINGALVLNKNHTLEIESANTEQFYESSKMETFVMISGPLLISDSLAQKLPDMNFSNKRHPRTCVGITNESVIFVTIDGRSELAEGMNLAEVQHACGPKLKESSIYQVITQAKGLWQMHC